uniref:Uncharacterized protein n=1 Tax=Neogobius melanostomus TaxID=47308 RepID=A0A8C6UR69_9GOBI
MLLCHSLIKHMPGERPHLLETPLDLSSPAKPPTTAPQLSRMPQQCAEGGVSESFLKRQRPISRRSYFNLLHIQTNRRLRHHCSMINLKKACTFFNDFKLGFDRN